MNTARRRHASVCVGGQVYVIGGVGPDKKTLSSVETLQRNSKHWDVLPDLPKAVMHSMATAYGQCVYVFGGIDSTERHTGTVYVYRTSRKSWKKLTDMPETCSFGAAVVWKDVIYLVGAFSRSCMSFDPVLKEWATLSRCRHEHADGPALVWKDMILVCGGRSREAKHDNNTSGRTSVIEEFDPEKNTWVVSQIELPQKLGSHVMFAIE